MFQACLTTFFNLTLVCWRITKFYCDAFISLCNFFFFLNNFLLSHVVFTECTYCPKLFADGNYKRGKKFSVQMQGQKNHDSAKLHNNHPFSPSYFIYLSSISFPLLGVGYVDYQPMINAMSTQTIYLYFQFIQLNPKEEINE